MGKHDWYNTDTRRQYAIRIDMSKYQDYEYIILEDISENLMLDTDITVNILEPGEDGKVTNNGTMEYETLVNEYGKFVIKIPVKTMDKGALAYDVTYYMTHDSNVEFSNKYRVYTVEEWEEENSGGNLDGNNEPKPDIPLEPSEPVVEDTPPKEDDIILPILPIEPDEDDIPEEVIEDEIEDSDIDDTVEDEIEDETEKVEIDEKPAKNEAPESILSDDKDVSHSITLPKTGSKSYNLIGLTILIIGVIMYRRVK